MEELSVVGKRFFVLNEETTDIDRHTNIVIESGPDFIGRLEKALCGHYDADITSLDIEEAARVFGMYQIDVAYANDDSEGNETLLLWPIYVF